MNREEGSLGLLAPSDMGNNESRESASEEDEKQPPHNVVSARGAVVDEQEVIHYAAAAEQLLASHSNCGPPTTAGHSKKKGLKKANDAPQQEGFLSVAASASAPYFTDQPHMSVATAVAAAAAVLKERGAKAATTTPGSLPTTSTALQPEGIAATETIPKPRRKKKKQRQTSQEEESAQALLALNKGGLGSSGGADTADNENAIIDDEEVAPVAASPRQIKKGQPKKKKGPKKHRSEAAVEEAEQSLPALFENAAGDSTMVDAFDGQLVDASPAATTEVAALSSATTPADSAGLPQLDIPDQRIITEHLAAHIAKTSPGGEEMMVEQRLINELQGIHPTILSTEKSTAPTQNGDNDIAHQFLDPSPPSKAVPKKRKRAADTTSTAQLNGVVDPQLMQIDQAAALAAGDGDAKKRKRRAVPPGFTEGTEGGDNVDTESALKKAILVSASTVATAPIRKTTDVKARSWGATPVSSTGEPINGGTFSLEERFAIDKALLDYCEVHDMTMDQLKDRVWGNNRKKDEFWDSICSAVPNRSRASVYKHVRRSCHIFQQRAKWTPDEDAQLAVLVKEKGNKWKDIGEAMGRMGEDCRDRYRNYVKCGTDRGTDRWSEEEEELLKKVVREHKDLTRQILISQGKHLPPPDQEDAVLINWTTVSEKMENKRSRIQCRYKWKKMLAQKEKVKQAPIGVTYVGGKKKRISFDICNMKPGDKQWLLNQIRDSPATQENEIPWDQFAKNDKKIGIWTHKDLKSAYQGFRAHIPHKRRPLNEIIKQLLAELEQEYTPEQRKLRFVPSQNDDVREQSQHSTPDSSTAADNFDQHLFNMVSSTPAPAPTVAPVASMAFPQQQQQQQQQQQTNSMVDPELMGQGMHELEKMAGAAIAHTTAMQHSNEDLEEQELRTRLGGYISTIQEGGPG